MEHKKLVEDWLHDVGLAVAKQLFSLHSAGVNPRKKGGSDMDGGWVEMDCGDFSVNVQIWQGVDHYRASVKIVVPDK